MCCIRHRLFIAVFLAIAFLTLNSETAQAQFQPPTNVTLTMYRLDRARGGARTNVLCTKNDPIIKKSYGCTAIEGNDNYAYPFNSSTITIGIDGTQGVDNAQYSYPYLWDVTPRLLHLHNF